jgi:hypothetical protein
MNNADLRTLADRVASGSQVTGVEAVILAAGVLRLIDEIKRLSGMLADEILDGAVLVPAEFRITPVPADLPDGFQEVDLEDEIL